jgi:hypothetical protein
VGFLAGVGTSLAAPAPAAPPAPSVAAAPAAGGTGVLAELRRAQRPTDRPLVPVGARLQLSTFRLLDSGSLSDLYVARDSDRRICLVAITIDDQFVAGCGPDPKGLTAPLLLRYTVTQPGRGDSVQVLASIDATTR